MVGTKNLVENIEILNKINKKNLVRGSIAGIEN